MIAKRLEIYVGFINLIMSYMNCLFQPFRPPYNGTTNDQWKCDDDLFCLFNFRRNHHRKRRWSHHGLEGRQGLKSLERNASGTTLIITSKMELYVFDQINLYFKQKKTFLL